MWSGSDDGRKRGMFSGRVEGSSVFLVDVVVSGSGACEISEAT